MTGIRTFIVAGVFLVVLCGFGCESYEPSIPSVGDYMPPAVSPTAEAVEKDEIGGPDHQLTLDTCVDIALSRNPVARAAGFGVSVAEQQVARAKSSYYPQMSAEGHLMRRESHIFLPSELRRFPAVTDTVGPIDDNAASLSAEYLLFDAGARRAQLLGAKARLTATRLDAQNVDLDLTLNVARAYFERVAAEEAVQVSQANVNRAKRNLELVREKRTAGMAVRGDVLRARTRRADEELALVRARSRLRIAKTSLKASMGLPVRVELSVKPQEQAIEDPSVNREAAITYALQARPDLEAALARISTKKHEVEAAQSEYGPTISARSRYGYRDSSFWPEDEEWSIGLFAEWPLFTGFERQHRVQQARMEVARQQAQTHKLALDIEQQVAGAIDRLREAYEAVQASEVLQRHARATLRDVRISYREGAAGVTDLLDAQTELAGAELSVVESRWSYFKARSALLRHAGIMPHRSIPSQFLTVERPNPPRP